MEINDKTAKRTDVVRAVVSYILSFLLTLALTAATGAVLVRFGGLSAKAIDSFLDEDYYRAALGDLVTEAEDYTIPTNISVSVLEDVFYQEDVKKDTLGYLYAAFSGSDYEPDFTGSDERLMNNLIRFFEEEDIERDGEIDAICNGYIAEIDEIYIKNVSVPGLETISSVGVKYGLALLAGAAMAAVLSLGLAFFILKLHRPASKGLKYLAYATGATAAICFILPAVLFFSRSYTKLNLTPEHLYRFTTGFISHILGRCMIAAGVWFAVTAVLVVLCVVFRPKKAVGPEDNIPDQEDQ